MDRDELRARCRGIPDAASHGGNAAQDAADALAGLLAELFVRPINLSSAEWTTVATADPAADIRACRTDPRLAGYEADDRERQPYPPPAPLAMHPSTAQR